MCPNPAYAAKSKMLDDDLLGQTLGGVHLEHAKVHLEPIGDAGGDIVEQRRVFVERAALEHVNAEERAEVQIG